MKSFQVLQTRNITIFIVILLGSVAFTSCRKDVNFVPIADNDLNIQGSPIPPYVFDWENETYLPSPSTSNQLQLPWNSGTSAIDPEFATDYLKVDGWELVWNTFSPTVSLNDPSYLYFFALYNKFRGLLRIYLWQQASPIATSYINNSLNIYGGPASSMLNFNAQEIIDVSNNQNEFTLMLNQQLNASGGTWLVFQYEMAYDPNIANLSFPAFGLNFKSQWLSLSSININGTAVGTIKGTVGKEQSPFNLGNFIQKGALTVLGSASYNTYLAAVNPLTKPNALKDAVGNALNGVVKDFINGIIGGSSGTGPIPVNLTFNSEIKLSGSLVTGGSLSDIKLVLPGQSNSQTANGNTPYYNNIMGVFNLSNQPKIYVSSTDYAAGPYEDPYSGSEIYYDWRENSYVLDLNSFQILWNPAVINSTAAGATIENIKIQIIQQTEGAFITMPGLQAAGEGYSTNPYVVTGTFSTIEKNGKYEIATSIPNSSIPLVIGHSYTVADLGTTAVRIIFDVVPNNGSPKSTLVHSFTPDIIQQ